MNGEIGSEAWQIYNESAFPTEALPPCPQCHETMRELPQRRDDIPYLWCASCDLRIEDDRD